MKAQKRTLDTELLISTCFMTYSEFQILEVNDKELYYTTIELSHFTTKMKDL